MEKQSWEERWNAEDERCTCCDSVIRPARGFNKQNLKRLIFSKPSGQDWMVLAMLVFILILAYSYKVEIRSCQAVLENPAEFCSYYNNNLLENQEQGEFNIIPFNNTETNKTEGT